MTPDGYAVNTLFPKGGPVAGWAKPERLLPPQTDATIGDRLDAKGVDWAWYSGGWDDAVAHHADPLFQFHHQPFAYFANYALGTPGAKAHLKDEKDFVDGHHARANCRRWRSSSRSARTTSIPATPACSPARTTPRS